MKYEATLKRGHSYTVFGRTFLKNVPHKKLLTEEQKEHLEANAIHTIKSTEGERISDCMFEFTARDGKAAEAQDTPPTGDDDGSEGGDGTGGEGGEGGEGGTGGEGGEGGTDETKKAPAKKPAAKRTRSRAAKKD